MNKSKKGMIGGAFMGAMVCGVRLFAAATAPLSYPICGAATGAAMATAMAKEMLDKGKLDNENPLHMGIGGAAIGLSSYVGFMIGLAVIPTAITEPILAPLAIPGFSYLGSQIAQGKDPVKQLQRLLKKRAGNFRKEEPLKVDVDKFIQNMNSFAKNATVKFETT